MPECEVIILHPRDEPVSCLECAHFLQGESGPYCGAWSEVLFSIHQDDCELFDRV